MTALFGLIASFAIIILAAFIGGRPESFLDFGSFLLVGAGTLTVTAVSFSWGELVGAPASIYEVAFTRAGDPSAAAIRVLKLSDQARKEQVLGLQKLVPALMRNEPFLGKGVRMLVDGMKPEDAEQILKREAGSVQARHQRSIDILRRAGEVAPAMGLIGTLLGLVQMLGTLDDPSSIGPAMALALLTTLYGAVLAHMVFIPLANRAERSSSEEALLNAVYTTGIVSIGRAENPRRIEMLLNALLPPAKRVKLFD